MAIYYKVKPDSDQIRTNLRLKGGFLIKNELYTERVINSALTKGKVTQSFIEKHFTKINIKPINTVWTFGARFETIGDYSKK